MYSTMKVINDLSYVQFFNDLVKANDIKRKRYGEQFAKKPHGTAIFYDKINLFDILASRNVQNQRFRSVQKSRSPHRSLSRSKFNKFNNNRNVEIAQEQVKKAHFDKVNILAKIYELGK